jgi:hypothetical protein
VIVGLSECALSRAPGDLTHTPSLLSACLKPGEREIVEGVEDGECEADQARSPPNTDGSGPLLIALVALRQGVQFGKSEEREPAQRDGQRHEQAGETRRAADLGVLEAKSGCGILAALLDPEALAIPGDRLSCVGLIGHQVPRLCGPGMTRITSEVTRRAPTEGDVDSQVARATLIALAVAHIGRPADLARLQSFRPQPPARAIGGDQASPGRDAHDVVKSALLQPGEEQVRNR